MDKKDERNIKRAKAYYLAHKEEILFRRREARKQRTARERERRQKKYGTTRIPPSYFISDPETLKHVEWLKQHRKEKRNGL